MALAIIHCFIYYLFIINYSKHVISTSQNNKKQKKNVFHPFIIMSFVKKIKIKINIFFFCLIN